MRPRAVFDTSTLVGAILRAGSVPYQALSVALNSCELCVSADTLAELENVLARRHFARYASTEARLAFVEVIRAEATAIEVNASSSLDLTPLCRDAKDDRFLALAVAAQAGVIVSSDQDLLVLHPWRGIAILTPAQFLAEFGT
ncbi:MAG: putative toxin-antitoxin system toxin component, PIN family [Terracidiphilus sp.]